jgi:hypothetical protein
MSGTSANDSIERLRGEIAQLLNPRVPAQLFQDASGLFVPGFTALPAVSIVPARPSRSSTQAEKFAAGQLYSFDVDYASSGGSKRVLTFFTPLGAFEVPPLNINTPPPKTKNVVTLQIETTTTWEPCELSFAWLPWGLDETDLAFQLGVLERFSQLPDVLVSRLRASLLVEGAEVPLNPVWGLGSWVPSPELESALFPVLRARHILEPFMFRLEISPSYTLPDGSVVALENKSISIQFTFPVEDLPRLYGKAGAGAQRLRSFSIIGNAIPVMNVDLKAWEPEATYTEFIKTSNMRPLGFAGLAAFKENRTLAMPDESPTPSLLPYSTQFSIELSNEGALVSRYRLAGSGDEADERQLLFWMTHGDEINGLKFRYNDSEPIQTLQVTTPSFKQVVTATPCFGGFSCGAFNPENLYESLVLNYGAPPQMLLYRDSLVYTVRDILLRLGYQDFAVREPFTEVRVIGGERRRVTVVAIGADEHAPVEDAHIRVVQDYLDRRSPLGSKIVIERR